VFNRPDEVRELLTSLVQQTVRDFEVIIVEDGSSMSSAPVVDQFREQLSIEYIFKQNSGPGPSRNMGFAHAKGNYFVVFDSDCIIPPHYLEAVNQALAQHHLDAWGGPDRAHASFTTLQQAMGYTMASVLTTGGIRGGKTHAGKFQPRSFNMGISRTVFEKTGGFKFNRLAEDIELSVRMRKMGFNVALVPDAFVYHKRRTTLRQFYQQVSSFGKGRVLVGREHRGEIKITHWFPSLFTIGLCSIPFFWIWNPMMTNAMVLVYGLYFVAIFLDALRVSRSLSVALWSVPAAWVQLVGYGLGFLKERVKSYII
jgi:glycosyltransferase involved in cell wall biosynthesis